MKRQQFQRELDYAAALCIAKTMLQQGLINSDEYCKLKAALIKKHRPLIVGIVEKSIGNPPSETTKQRKEVP